MQNIIFILRKEDKGRGIQEARSREKEMGLESFPPR
jgi:hypothetical protein